MDESRERIIKAAVQAVRQYGLEGARIQNISDLAGYTPGALYRYFKSKDEIMQECFFSIARQLSDLFDEAEIVSTLLEGNPRDIFRQLWRRFFRFWLTHPDETVFFYRYRNGAAFLAYGKSPNLSCFSTLAKMMDCLVQYMPGLSRLNRDLLWLHVLTGTVMYAKYVVQGVLPDTAEIEEDIYQLIVHGLDVYIEQG